MPDLVRSSHLRLTRFGFIGWWFVRWTISVSLAAIYSPYGTPGRGDMVFRHVGGRLNHRKEHYVVNDDVTPV